MRREELAAAAVAYITKSVVGSDSDITGPAVEQRLASILDLSASRFLGVGAEQYQISETEQSFERSTIPTMLVGAIEEVVDLANYAAMIDILIERRLESGESNVEQFCRLEDLRADLATATAFAASSGVMLDVYVNMFVESGEYERPLGDYVSALSAEVAATGASIAAGSDDAEVVEQTQAARVQAELDYINGVRAANGKPLISSLDGTPVEIEIVRGELGEVAAEVRAKYGEAVEFVGLPKPELDAATAYIAELENSIIESYGDEYLAMVRRTVENRGGIDGDALAEWFGD